MIQKRNTGFLLLELALALAIASLFLIPLTKLHFTLTQANKAEVARAERTAIENALSAFIITHGRLPCPSEVSYLEDRQSNQHCKKAFGKLPSGTLGLSTSLSNNWHYVVATLETAGPPAAHSLFKNNPFEDITIQTLTGIILQPITTSIDLEDSALPALHACLLSASESLPEITKRGCGQHQLHSPSLIAFALPKKNNHWVNEGRTHQVFTDLPNPEQEPIWISYEQFVWLKTKAGQIN